MEDFTVKSSGKNLAHNYLSVYICVIASLLASNINW